MKEELKRNLLIQLEAYASSLVAAIRVMDERRYILQPLLRDEDVKIALADKFHSTRGAAAFNHLVPLIAGDFVREIARLFLDEQNKAGSFVNLYRKASEKVIHQALREKFTSIPDRWHNKPGAINGLTEEQSDQVRERWREKDKTDFSESFDKAWARVVSAVESLAADPVAEKIRTFRDKYHAHFEMSPLGSDPGPFDVSSLDLTYNDLIDFIDSYVDAVYELSRLLTGTVYNVEEFAEIHKRSGSDMWRILADLKDKL